MSKHAALPFGLPPPPPGRAQKPAGVSLCMIVKNEERYLERCLSSVAGVVDEINVVDTGSTDRTIEIARKFGAHIEEHPWQDDFSDARNRSLAMARKRWILTLDADEELNAESVAELKALRNVPANMTAVLVRCLNIAEHANSASGTVSHAIVRIFPNDTRIRFRGRIHEYVAVADSPTSIAAVPSPVKITHYGYADSVIAERGKLARNTRMIELSVEAEPDEPYNWYNLGMTAHVGGDQRRAAQALERMWELCRRNNTLRLFLGNGLQMLSTIYTEHLSDPEKGLLYANDCLKIAPHYANAHFAVGKAYSAMRRFDEAREAYRQAMQDAAYIDRQFVVDEDAAGWKPACEIGCSYAAEGNHEQALTWFDKAFELKPEVRPIRVHRAAAFEKLGRVDDARLDHESLHRQFGDEQSALALINFLLRHDSAAALEVIERESPGLSDAAAVPVLQAALHLAISSSDFERAARIAQAGIERAPSDPAFRYDAAIAAANLGSKEAALEHLEYIGRDVPVYDRAQYLRALLLRELTRFDESLEALDRVAQLTGPHVDSLLLRASVLERAGRKGEAEAAFREALPLEKKRASIELAAFYLREGRAMDAKRVAEEALA